MNILYKKLKLLQSVRLKTFILYCEMMMEFGFAAISNRIINNKFFFFAFNFLDRNSNETQTKFPMVLI